ncbi:VOC family protein [Vibrio parahaemolyticus]|nr:VOC family protein [Vibrio parahaemolyticus]MDF4691864.1 VOC family protein [Vibrio parahaemolyticus]
MKLGANSISLNVKCIKASREFYEKLGFEVTGGSETDNWLILKNDTCIIGLFQGMFERNILTFNPGWDNNATMLDEFDDVRVIQETLQKKGLTFTTLADPNLAGPASCMLEDPDGNPILIDQHR